MNDDCSNTCLNSAESLVFITINDQKVFNPCQGGVSPSERGLVWRFLFGMYPCSSTALERHLLQEQLFVRYGVMKRKWQQFLPSGVRMHLNGTDGKGPNAHKLNETHNEGSYMSPKCVRFSFLFFSFCHCSSFSFFECL